MSLESDSLLPKYTTLEEWKFDNLFVAESHEFQLLYNIGPKNADMHLEKLNLSWTIIDIW